MAADIVRTNDTVVFNVLSRHQLPALAPKNVSINYGDSINLTVISNDSIYWFLNSGDMTPVLKSKQYQTSRLYSDTTFYFSRKSEIPSLKISEIQYSKQPNAQGVTPNLHPNLTSQNLIELSNYGNGDINLGGIQFAYIVGTVTRGSGANQIITDSLLANLTKTIVFGNHILDRKSTRLNSSHL